MVKYKRDKMPIKRSPMLVENTIQTRRVILFTEIYYRQYNGLYKTLTSCRRGGHWILNRLWTADVYVMCILLVQNHNSLFNILFVYISDRLKKKKSKTLYFLRTLRVWMTFRRFSLLPRPNRCNLLSRTRLALVFRNRQRFSICDLQSFSKRFRCSCPLTELRTILRLI